MQHRSRAMLIRAILCALPFLPLFAGCQEDVTYYREVKRIHEKVSESEMQRFVRIVEKLPEKKLPELSVYRPLPDWIPQRTLPVDELVKEEQKLLERGWDVEWQTEQLKRNRHLVEALRRENTTIEQFAGLTLAIGAALSRSQLREEQDLETILNRGRVVAARLLHDQRTFAKLTRDERYTVLRKAAWLTRLDRASRLADVPPENLALIEKHQKELAAIFPKEFLKNPLDDIADLLEEKGMPFEQLDSSGRDEDLTWDRANAVIGYDKPDAVQRP